MGRSMACVLALLLLPALVWADAWPATAPSGAPAMKMRQRDLYDLSNTAADAVALDLPTMARQLRLLHHEVKFLRGEVASLRAGAKTPHAHDSVVSGSTKTASPEYVESRARRAVRTQSTSTKEERMDSPPPKQRLFSTLGSLESLGTACNCSSSTFTGNLTVQGGYVNNVDLQALYNQVQQLKLSTVQVSGEQQIHGTLSLQRLVMGDWTMSPGPNSSLEVKTISMPAHRSTVVLQSHLRVEQSVQATGIISAVTIQDINSSVTALGDRVDQVEAQGNCCSADNSTLGRLTALEAQVQQLNVSDESMVAKLKSTIALTKRVGNAFEVTLGEGYYTRVGRRDAGFDKNSLRIRNNESVLPTTDIDQIVSSTAQIANIADTGDVVIRPQYAFHVAEWTGIVLFDANGVLKRRIGQYSVSGTSGGGYFAGPGSNVPHMKVAPDSWGNTVYVSSVATSVSTTPFLIQAFSLTTSAFVRQWSLSSSVSSIIHMQFCTSNQELYLYSVSSGAAAMLVYSGTGSLQCSWAAPSTSRAWTVDDHTGDVYWAHSDEMSMYSRCGILNRTLTTIEVLSGGHQLAMDPLRRELYHLGPDVSAGLQNTVRIYNVDSGSLVLRRDLDMAGMDVIARANTTSLVFHHSATRVVYDRDNLASCDTSTQPAQCLALDSIDP